MLLTAEPLELPLKSPFRIAHGTSTARRNVLVRLGDGLGEGALPPYYPYTVEDVQAYVGALDPEALLEGGPLALEDALDRLPPGPAPARTALDMALHDLWGLTLGQPLYRLLGLNPERAPFTTVTLSIPENEEGLYAAIESFRDYPILKLKLGTGSLHEDEAIVRRVRSLTQAQLCVDANGAWSIEEAAHIIPRLSAYDLLFVEQPIPAGDPLAWRQLREQLPSGVVPLIADESIQTATDILQLAPSVDGVNVKVAKAGGLRAVRRLIALARVLDLHVMLGCMIESSVALTAAAHLAPLADYADLDGTLYLAGDPFEGMHIDKGRIVLPDRPGLGVLEAKNAQA